MKVAFWTLFVAGFVGCSTLGIGPVLDKMGGDWLSAPMVLGSVMGIALLGLAVSMWAGARPGLLGSDSTMLVILGVLIGVKVLVANLAAAGR